jgi:streptogramin lyase
MLRKNHRKLEVDMIVRAEVRSLLSRSSLIAGACIALAACRGGSPLPSAAPPGAPDSGSISRSDSAHTSIPVTVNLVVPTSKASSLRGLGERNPFFVVFGTKGAKVVAYAHGNRTTPLGTAVANVLGRSPACTKGAARVCALKLSLKATGKDDFVITTYDQPPSGGVIPVTAKQLAAGLEVKKIGPKGKTFTAVVGGVVASTSLYLSQGAVSSIDATTFSANVVARDVDGNAIVTGFYESATGTRVNVTLGSSAIGGTSFSFNPASFSSAAKGLAVTVNYKPSGVTGAQVQAGFSTVLSATANNGATPGTATFAALAPQITEFTTPTAASGPQEMTPGSDGAIWFTEYFVGKIARIPTNATSGTQITEFATSSAASFPFGIVSGPDGQLWFTEQSGNKIGHIPVTATSGSDISEIALPIANSFPTGITAGSDNALYFTEQGGNRVGRIPTNATSTSAITEITLPVASSFPFAMSTAADGTIWFTEQGGAVNSVAHMPVGATLPSQVTSITMPTALSTPLGIARGAAGTMIVSEYGGHKMASVPLGATSTVQITEFSAGTAAPEQTVLGPDGAIWFAETNANKVGRIATDGTLLEFTVPTIAAKINGITIGPDGAIWFAETNSGKVGKIQ